jgi:hypothetical protein
MVNCRDGFEEDRGEWMVMSIGWMITKRNDDAEGRKLTNLYRRRAHFRHCYHQRHLSISYRACARVRAQDMHFFRNLGFDVWM